MKLDSVTDNVVILEPRLCDRSAKFNKNRSKFSYSVRGVFTGRHNAS
jgi:hypothetical protein